MQRAVDLPGAAHLALAEGWHTSIRNRRKGTLSSMGDKDQIIDHILPRTASQTRLDGFAGELCHTYRGGSGIGKGRVGQP